MLVLFVLGLSGIRSVDAQTPTCIWIPADDKIVKITPDGKELTRITSVHGRGFAYSIGFQNIVGVDQADGSVWVTDVNNNRILKLTSSGEPILEKLLWSPVGISVDPADGSVWTTELTSSDLCTRVAIKLDRDGVELVRVTGFSSFLSAVSVNGTDGGVWIADRWNNQIVGLFGTDEELNGYDASGDSGRNHVRISGFIEPQDISVNATDDGQGSGNVWVADRVHGQAVKLSHSGSELVRATPTGFYEVRFVSASPVDGSVWVGDPNTGRIAKLSSSGAEVVNLPINPGAILADPNDDSVWVLSGGGVVKLDSDGSELLSWGGLPPTSPTLTADITADKVSLSDLNSGKISRDFSPGTNIRYKVKFTVNGDPGKLYKVVVTGKSSSLYRPWGIDPEWKDRFDNPIRKGRKLFGGQSEKVYWDRRIPSNATPGEKAKVKFTLRLKEYDEATGTWNLLGRYYAKKRFNIVQ